MSEANRDFLSVALRGRGRVEVVRNSADLRRLGSPNGASREPELVLSVARLVEKKGLDDLIEACRLLGERGRAVRLEVVGDGPLRERLEHAAASGGVDVVFHGALPQERVLPLFRRAAVVCLPCVVVSTGDRDGLPTSLLEAMALGAPVVSTPVGGIGELVLHEETGLLVPERDPGRSPTRSRGCSRSGSSPPRSRIARARTSRSATRSSATCQGCARCSRRLPHEDRVPLHGPRDRARREQGRGRAHAEIVSALAAKRRRGAAPAEARGAGRGLPAGVTVDPLPAAATDAELAGWLEERLSGFGAEALYERLALYSAAARWRQTGWGSPTSSS